MREQIVTQIRLGVATRDLAPGEKLPSTREVARRFGIHANTVSAAYRELARANVVAFRKGSGVFVAETNEEQNAAKGIDEMLADFVGELSEARFARREIEEAIEKWLGKRADSKVVIVESDLGLRSIIEEEISTFLGVSAASISLDEFTAGRYDTGVSLVALNDEKEKMQPNLAPGQKAVFIDANSVPHSLIGEERPDRTNLIAVVSGWRQFIAFARIYLLAARVDPEALIIRSTSEPEWKAGLDSAAMVICDSFTAKQFPGDERVRVFRLITDASIEKLKNTLT